MVDTLTEDANLEFDVDQDDNSHVTVMDGVTRTENHETTHQTIFF